MDWQDVVRLSIPVAAVVVTSLLGVLLGWRLRGSVVPRLDPDQAAATGQDQPPVGRRPRSGLGRAALDSLQVGVLVIEPSDRLAVVNPGARKLGLLAGNGQRGDRIEVVVHPDALALVAKVRADGQPREIELDLRRPDGSRTHEPLAVNVRAHALEDGYVVVEATDITDAHRLARVRRDFVANVSHELKTPVGALRLLAEALIAATGGDQFLNAAAGDQSRGAAGDQSRNAAAGDQFRGGDDGQYPDADLAAARRYAERIRHESTRLARLVSELIELSRLQGAEPFPEPEPVAVERIVAEVIDRTRTPATAKEIEIVVDIPRGLIVHASESQLVTAVANLVENAVAYSGERTLVQLSARVTGDAIELGVTDQGIGIESDDLDRIFERFYRADRARSRATGGTGLGLAIVKHIATNHGGSVQVASTVGVGSTFTLRLPVRRRDAMTPPSAHDEISSDSSTAGG